MHHGRMKTGRIAAVNGLLFMAVVALSPAVSRAECRSWDVSGSWFLQGAGDFYNLHLTQKGYSITGLATMGSAQTKVTGNVTGSGFYLHLVSKGFELRGDIGADGKIHGIVHDLSNPKKLAFVSSRAMKCGDTIVTAPPAQTSPKRLIKSSGKARTETTSSPEVPRIGAFNKPGQASTQIVTWDGGPDHPYAEVWVSVDGGDETKVVEQGKGTRQMPVEPGKTYRYILTDSGKQLATTTVKAK